MNRFDTFIEDATALVRHLPDRDDTLDQIEWLRALMYDAEQAFLDLQQELRGYGGTD